MDDVASPGYVSLGAGRTRSSGMPRGNLYAGHIAEILIYDDPLDETERAAIDAYVSAKYGGAPGGGFRRGDANADGAVNLTDGIAVLLLPGRRHRSSIGKTHGRRLRVHRIVMPVAVYQALWPRGPTAPTR